MKQHTCRLKFQVRILYKSIADRYWPVRVADGPITARYRFVKNASWVVICVRIMKSKYSD